MNSATRRRSRRRRPLAEFASRSPLHAFEVWVLESALVLTMGVIFILLVMNVAVPMMSGGFIRVIQDR